MSGTRLLHGIGSPEDLRRLPREQVEQVANEIRAEILERVSQTGGHLASSLGAVELITAIHAVFDTPRDRLVLDVGHQGYPHKLLTGRREAFDRIGLQGGISKFLRRSESEYDHFGAGHAGTSISAALGMARGKLHRGEAGLVIALIGDGVDDGGHGFRSLESCRAPAGEESRRHPQRQRDVDLAQRRRAVLLPVAQALRAHGAAHERLGEGVPRRHAGRRAALGAQGRGIAQGLLLAGTALRGLELPLRGPHPGPPHGRVARDLREREGDGRKRQRPDPGARPHGEGPRLRARRGRSAQVPRCRRASTSPRVASHRASRARRPTPASSPTP